MSITTKRIYDEPSPDDGYRVLIDRLWPRGVSKAKARLDAWEKEVAPSTELREWYGHDPDKWPEFKKRYARELRNPAAKAVLDDLVERGKHGTVTLLYSSRAGEISNSAALDEMLTRRLRRSH